MAPMKRITMPMHRYGEADFDLDYLRWGLHDHETQVREAESLLNILKPAAPLSILDLACGIGTHAVYWAKQGHTVTGVDLSETFISRAREAAGREQVAAGFRVADIRSLDDCAQFDVITWIESSFFDEDIACRIYRALRPGGVFITDVRNPDHPRTRARGGNWRTWREENGVFYLERHETDPVTGRHEDTWLTIDPEREVIEERMNTGNHLAKNLGIMDVLKQVGFREVGLKTMDGQDFVQDEEPYWLWLLARRNPAGERDVSMRGDGSTNGGGG